MKRTLIAVIAAAPLLAGCGAYAAAHDFNAPTPARIIPGNWARIETPGNFPSVVFECLGKDGIYQTQDQYSSVQVIAGDPNCLPGADVSEGRP